MLSRQTKSKATLQRKQTKRPIQPGRFVHVDYLCPFHSRARVAPATACPSGEERGCKEQRQASLGPEPRTGITDAAHGEDPPFDPRQGQRPQAFWESLSKSGTRVKQKTRNGGMVNLS